MQGMALFLAAKFLRRAAARLLALAFGSGLVHHQTGDGCVIGRRFEERRWRRFSLFAPANE